MPNDIVPPRFCPVPSCYHSWGRGAFSSARVRCLRPELPDIRLCIYDEAMDAETVYCAAIWISLAGGLLQLFGVGSLLHDLYKDILGDLWRPAVRGMSRVLQAVKVRLWRSRQPVTPSKAANVLAGCCNIGPLSMAAEVHTVHWESLDTDGRLDWLRGQIGRLEKEDASMRAQIDQRAHDLVRIVEGGARQTRQTVERLDHERRREEEHRTKVSKRSSIPLLAGVLLSAVVSPALMLLIA